uniref:Uncharacterized protein n=1 Tax=Fagus sylvatica TaxID=28930 RepID=A0A2N9H0S5_FAGSY
MKIAKILAALSSLSRSILMVSQSHLGGFGGISVVSVVLVVLASVSVFSVLLNNSRWFLVFLNASQSKRKVSVLGLRFQRFCKCRRQHCLLESKTKLLGWVTVYCSPNSIMGIAPAPVSRAWSLAEAKLWPWVFLGLQRHVHVPKLWWLANLTIASSAGCQSCSEDAKEGYHLQHSRLALPNAEVVT